MNYDVIVIGAGSAGSIVASRLSQDPRRSVLLLEAGPDYSDGDSLPRPLQWGGNYLLSAFGGHTWGYMAQTTAEQPQPVPVPRGKVTGGTSTIHGQFYLRGLPEDYNRWAALGNPDWSCENVLPCFLKLERDLDFRDGNHGATGPMPVRRMRREAMLPSAQAFYAACLGAGYPDCPDHNTPDRAGIGPTPSNNLDGTRISTAIAYLAEARKRPNLTIRPNTFVRRVVIEGGRARAVEIEDGGGAVLVYADEIVLSAGAVASPHLLMHSGVGPAQALADVGIAGVQDLPGVGANLLDHPYVLPVFRATGSPDLGEISVEVVLRYTAEGSSSRNDMQIGPAGLDSSMMPPESGVKPGEACFCIYTALMNPASSGSVRLSSNDPHVHPVLDYRHLSERTDLVRLRDGMRRILDLAERPEFRDIIVEQISLRPADYASDAALDAWILRNIGVAGVHSAGTCRMGPASDSMSVVDQQCRVHGVQGLRVVDASVMPAPVSANTNATTMMIAERVADWMN